MCFLYGTERENIALHVRNELESSDLEAVHAKIAYHKNRV